MLRAKFKVAEVAKDYYGNEKVMLHAVYGDGKANAEWSKATPSGNLTMTISNPDAHGKLEVGKEYFLDFTLADEPKG